MTRAEAGDPETVPVVQEMLRHPVAVRRLGGDLAGEAQANLIKALAAGNAVKAQAVERHLEIMRDELLGPRPTAIECLLVERVLTCWLQLQHADRTADAPVARPVKQAEFLNYRRDRAHRRILSAVKALAQVRKLALPAIQVNICDKQVNVAG